MIQKRTIIRSSTWKSVNKISNTGMDPWGLRISPKGYLYASDYSMFNRVMVWSAGAGRYVGQLGARFGTMAGAFNTAFRPGLYAPYCTIAGVSASRVYRAGNAVKLFIVLRDSNGDLIPGDSPLENVHRMLDVSFTGHTLVAGQKIDYTVSASRIARVARASRNGAWTFPTKPSTQVQVCTQTEEDAACSMKIGRVMTPQQCASLGSNYKVSPTCTLGDECICCVPVTYLQVEATAVLKKASAYVVRAASKLEGGQHIDGSPFLITVIASDPDARISTTSGEGLSKCVAGTLCQFDIVQRDQFENLADGGGKLQGLKFTFNDKVAIEVYDESDLDANVMFRKQQHCAVLTSAPADGVVTVKYVCLSSGETKLEISSLGTTVASSPYVIAMTHNRIDPQSTLVQGNGLDEFAAGETRKITFTLKDRYGNPVQPYLGAGTFEMHTAEKIEDIGRSDDIVQVGGPVYVEAFLGIPDTQSEADASNRSSFPLEDDYLWSIKLLGLASGESTLELEYTVPMGIHELAEKRRSPGRNSCLLI